jgi:hypothetical protein
VALQRDQATAYQSSGFGSRNGTEDEAMIEPITYKEAVGFVVAAMVTGFFVGMFKEMLVDVLRNGGPKSG